MTKTHFTVHHSLLCGVGEINDIQGGQKQKVENFDY